MPDHFCSNLIIRCIDFRIMPHNLSSLLEGAGVCHDGEYDLVSVAGAGKDLLSEVAGEKEFILKQIRISKKLHHVTTIIILMHQNCGAYGVEDDTEEEKMQIDHLHRITDLLHDELSDIIVKGFIVTGVSAGQLGLRAVD